MTAASLRRLPVPASEPPFDDEGSRRGAVPAPAVQGTLALAFLLPGGLPASPPVPRGLRLVPPPVPDPDRADFGPQPTPRAALPDPRAWAARLTQALVEVMAGDRPVVQLVRWTTSAVYDEVAELVVSPAARPAGPVRGVVRSVHVTEPADGVAEVAATVRRGPRSTAVALRLEGLDGRWQCTAVELG